MGRDLRLAKPLDPQKSYRTQYVRISAGPRRWKRAPAPAAGARAAPSASAPAWRGILLEPLVEKRADFLPEIGGMPEAREFIALQRGARSRENEFPRGLRLLAVHKGLLETDVVK